MYLVGYKEPWDKECIFLELPFRQGFASDTMLMLYIKHRYRME